MRGAPDMNMNQDKDVTIADLQAKLATMTDARFRMEQRVERLLHFLEDLERALERFRHEVHETLIAGGKW
jgi:hypothetical protein